MAPRFLLALTVLFAGFELSPAFSGAPAHKTLRLHARGGPLCLFGKPSEDPGAPQAVSKTRKISADSAPARHTGPARQPHDPMTYGQRIYPVHPSDLSVEDRRGGLLRLVLWTGVRDCMVGLLVAFAMYLAGAGVDGKDQHFPVVAWLISCIVFGRVLQDGLAPAVFHFDHMSLAPTDAKRTRASASRIQRSDSFAQWRESAINPGFQDDVALRRVRDSKWQEQGAESNPRMVVEYSEAVPVDERVSWPRTVGMAVTAIVWGLLSDVGDALVWLTRPRSNSEPNPEDPRDSSDFEVWDPRDPHTPTEPGV